MSTMIVEPPSALEHTVDKVPPVRAGSAVADTERRPPVVRDPGKTTAVASLGALRQ
jgi:hypothetical protein